MPGPWFDTLEGKLVIGEAAYEQVIEQSFPGQIVPFGELLLQDVFEYKPGDFERPPRGKGLSPEQKVELGKWTLAKLEETAGQPVMLVSEHLNRLHILGITPTRRAMVDTFDDVDGYREAIDSPISKGTDSERFNQMSEVEMVSYAQQLASALGRVPTGEDFKAVRGPSRHALDKAGGKAHIRERLGRMNIREFDETRYVQWGVLAMRVNGPKRFTTTLISVLAGRGKGPWLNSIQRQFTRWSTFKAAVLEEYEAQKLTRDEAQVVGRQLLEILTHTTHNPQAGENVTLSDSIGARYKLALHLLGGKDGAELIAQRIAMYDQVDIIDQLMAVEPGLTVEEIENASVELGVENDIWPPEHDIWTELYVSDEELAVVRQKKLKNQTKHERKRADAMLRKCMPKAS